MKRNRVNKGITDECNVTNGKRFGAYIIDWFVGSLIIALPINITWMLLSKDVDTMATANVLQIADKFNLTNAYIAGAISIVAALFYYVYVPLKIYHGQTLGKRIMGFKIVKNNGKDVDLKTLILREVIGIIIIEGSLYSISGILHSLISLVLKLNLIGVLMYIGYALSIISGFILLFRKNRRMLHDYIAKSKVVLCDNT